MHPVIEAVLWTVFLTVGPVLFLEHTPRRWWR